jgi:hypothetical protein
MAREIPNTRFVGLDSPNHIVLSHEPAWHRFIDEVCGLLKLEQELPRPAAIV